MTTSSAPAGENLHWKQKACSYFQNCGKTAKRELLNFFSYIKSNYLFLSVAVAVFLVVYSRWIFHTLPHIDSDNLINNPYYNYNWLQIGRQFGIFTKWLFGLRWFNPAVATTLGYLLICLAGIVFGYLFWRCTKRSGWACSLFLLPFFISPVFTEQFYFDLQTFEIGWALLLCAVGLGLGLYGALHRSYTALALFAVAALWAVGTYQSFAVLLTAMILLCFALIYRRKTVFAEGPVPGKTYAAAFGKVVAAFAAAIVVYVATTLLWFSGSSYTTSNFYWLTQPFSQCVKSIFRHIYIGFLGKNVFYTWTYLLLALLCIGSAVWDACKTRQKFSAFYAAFVFLLQLSPFLLTVVFGGINSVRAQIAYPFVFAADLLFLCSRSWAVPAWKVPDLQIVLILLSAALFFSQANVTSRLIYTDLIRSQEDIRLATEIEHEITEVSDIDQPIVIVGHYTPKLNAACSMGEMIGCSVFSFCYPLEPYYYYNTATVCGVLKTLGFSFQAADQEQVLEARIYARDNDMPSWPKEGSVVDAGGYTIIKLSEDEFVSSLPAEK